MCGLFVGRWFMVPRSSCGETFASLFFQLIFCTKALNTRFLRVNKDQERLPQGFIRKAFLEISKSLQNKIHCRVLFSVKLQGMTYNLTKKER